jgi:ketosteroid isomerase-like protein
MFTTQAQEILRQEEQLADAKRTLDLDALNRIYADELLMTGVLGEPTCTKAAVIDEARRGVAQRDSAVASGQAFETSCNNEDVTVATHGDTAIANYRFVVKFTGPNVDVHRRYRTTNVWIKRDGRWQIIAAHTAFVLDAKQAAMLAGEAR